MTLHPASFALGFIAAYLFSLLVLGLALWGSLRQEKKQRDDALDELLTNVGIACVETPTDVPTNVRVN